MVRTKQKVVYRYDCTITGENFRTTREAAHPKELVSVKAFYELNPDKDDRPDYIKKQAEVEWVEEQERARIAAELRAQYEAQNKDS